MGDISVTELNIIYLFTTSYNIIIYWGDLGKLTNLRIDEFYIIKWWALENLYTHWLKYEEQPVMISSFNIKGLITYKFYKKKILCYHTTPRLLIAWKGL